MICFKQSHCWCHWFLEFRHFYSGTYKSHCVILLRFWRNVTNFSTAEFTSFFSLEINHSNWIRSIEIFFILGECCRLIIRVTWSTSFLTCKWRCSTPFVECFNKVQIKLWIIHILDLLCNIVDYWTVVSLPFNRINDNWFGLHWLSFSLHWESFLFFTSVFQMFHVLLDPILLILNVLFNIFMLLIILLKNHINFGDNSILHCFSHLHES